MRVIRILVGASLTLVLGAAALLARLIPAPAARLRWLTAVRRAWARSLLSLLNVRVTVDPAAAACSGPALYVANHTGYLDILVLMSVTPGVFISRADVRWWPLLGQAAWAGGTLFVDRSKRLSVGHLVRRVRRRLDKGAGVIFFPEARTSDGEGLLPFKSPLFAAAVTDDRRTYPIRPVVLRYRSVAGHPLDASNRHRVHWSGDARLIPHLWWMLAAPGVGVVVRTLPERPLTGDRHAFARDLRDEMLRAYENLATPG